jgi:hypothetical protein
LAFSVIFSCLMRSEDGWIENAFLRFFSLPDRLSA